MIVHATKSIKYADVIPFTTNSCCVGNVVMLYVAVLIVQCRCLPEEAGAGYVTEVCK